ncbi:hypothetical protein RB595_002704 [Gaeumannomyces hyphopodioides]
MPSPTTPSAETVKALQAATLFAVSAASGATLGISFFTVPLLLDSPTPLMLRLWERNLTRSRDAFVPADLLCSLGFAALAALPARPARCRYAAAAAAALAAAVVPYTLLVVMPTNRKLLRRAELARALGPAVAGDADEDVVRPADEPESSKLLVDRWGMLNLGRCALLISSAALGFYATLS